jgi:hypothetical protein
MSVEYLNSQRPESGTEPDSRPLNMSKAIVESTRSNPTLTSILDIAKDLIRTSNIHPTTFELEKLEYILVEMISHKDFEDTPLTKLLTSLHNRRNVIPTPYDQREIECIRRRRVRDSIDIKILDGTSKIHDNQRISAAKINAELMHPTTLFVLLVALTQSGKTGTMSALIRQYLLEPHNFTPVKHIIIITGLSDKDWRAQMEVRIAIDIRILHRNEINDKFIEELSQMRNVLLIFDEIQVACKDTQTLSKLFVKAGLQDLDSLFERDIKCVEFSATPDGALYNLSNKFWKNHTKIIKGEPGPGYTSLFDLYDQGRVLESKDLRGFDNDYSKSKKNKYFSHSAENTKKETLLHIQEIKEKINSFDSYRYHLFRIHGGDTQVNLNLGRIFGINDYNYLEYNQHGDIKNLNEVLSTPPEKHTFILIKEKLRCAATLVKTHIGVLYERYSLNPSDSVNVQGLAGRNTGYDVNKDSIVYTNVDSILRYRQLWDSDFLDNSLPWISSSTYRKNDETHGKDTFNHPRLFITNYIDNRKERYIIFTDFSDIGYAADFHSHFIPNSLPNNVRGPKKRKPITSDLSLHKGFYDAAIKKITKVWSENEMKPSTWVGVTNNNYRLYPCYTDINDINTLKWYLISKNLKPEKSMAFN